MKGMTDLNKIMKHWAGLTILDFYGFLPQ